MMNKLVLLTAFKSERREFVKIAQQQYLITPWILSYKKKIYDHFIRATYDELKGLLIADDHINIIHKIHLRSGLFSSKYWFPIFSLKALVASPTNYALGELQLLMGGMGVFGKIHFNQFCRFAHF
jgi:hypothetical protein